MGGMYWRCCNHTIDLTQHVCVMGIVNVTPDSFSDGGEHDTPQAAIEYGKLLLAEGAAILDIGGESTRPGSDPVTLEDELGRTIPVVEALAAEPGAVISIDTMKPEVARQALAAGAAIINDVTALREPEMIQIAAESGAGVVLMHMRGEPKTMQQAPHYADVVGEVAAFLRERAAAARAAGIAAECIALDPGIGFGKSFEHNLTLFRHMREFTTLGHPLLVGTSRKAFIGRLLGGVPAGERLEGTAAAISTAVLAGARIVRVHDVKEMLRVVKVAEALR